MRSFYKQGSGSRDQGWIFGGFAGEILYFFLFSGIFSRIVLKVRQLWLSC